MINQRSLALIKKFEGLRLAAYRDSGGVATIGYGTTVYPNGQKVKMGQKITAAEAVTYLLHDIQTIRLPALAKLVKVRLTSNEAGALISFVYNVGVEAFKGSTMLQLLNGGAQKREVASEFTRWNKVNGKGVKGLTRRRNAEAELFLAPDEPQKLKA